MNLKHPNTITSLILVGILLLAILVASMVDNEQPQGMSFPVAESGFTFPYTLDQPNKEYWLPNSLQEISGLSWSGQEQIMAVQDEKGLIYVYDLKQEEIVEKIRFGKNLDYEGIELVGKKTYILKSDGDIFKIDSLSGDEVKSVKYETALKLDQDAEGLGYDAKGNQLLIALKAEKIKSKSEKEGDKRVVYGFDLEHHRLTKTPVLYIDQLALGRLVYKKEKSYSIHPSGIAVHPKSGDIYIIASAGKILVVLKRNGKLRHAERLDPAQFPQPEGITFAPDGRLILASEGKGGRGRLLIFEAQ